MDIRLSMLLSDWLIYGLVALGIVLFFRFKNQPHFREPWRQVIHNPVGMIALVVLIFYVTIGLLDSIHLEITDQRGNQILSVFDLLVAPLGQQDEQSYSAPFATHLYNRSMVPQADGTEINTYPRTQFSGAYLKNPSEKNVDILFKILKGTLLGLISFLILALILIKILAMKHSAKFTTYTALILKGRTWVAWREMLMTFAVLWILTWIARELATAYHIFGTDKVGNDVFYETLKSIRTGLLIGTLTTLFTLPFALILGMVAGYYRGIADDIIQYLYTTLSSIPGVLLISASVLVLQVYITNHPNLFPTLIERADARLLALCFILGITSWASLCRLLRAETLKLREQEFTQAAVVLGVKHFKILFRHIMPNLMHIVLITLVLDFSGLVLTEAVLSYIGVGVDPTTLSWGNMINSSRLELGREPIVWWPLVAAFVFMFILVLAANIFSDAVRDAFDPRLKST